MNEPSAVRRRHLRFPPPRPPLGKPRRLLQNALGLLLLPYALAAAAMRGTPGLRIRLRCIALGLRALARGEARQAFGLIVNPMDSIRYFELDYIESCVPRPVAGTYLDVSSPRLVFLTILDRQKSLVADVVNPIAGDLQESMALARALALDDRCRPLRALIEEAGYREGSFDLVTSVSVIEHIPNDRDAVATMWSLLRPGGRLVITVPCAREACEEYTNLDEYGLFDSSDEGLTYWQRYYDEEMLATSIWSVTGPPLRTRIYGETAPGNYDRNVMRKRTEPSYPYWLEPVMMGREYRYYDSIAALPGMGVIGMEFVKPEEAARG
jgi:SAM-dependent methyltransferase